MSSMPPASAQILIVDDDPHNRRLLSEICAAEGYATREAESAEQALDQLAVATFDLLLLDISLPGMDGLDLLERVRQEHLPEDLPVVMVTANPEAQGRQRAEALGVSSYVEKPYRVFDLTRRLRIALLPPGRTSMPPSSAPLQHHLATSPAVRLGQRRLRLVLQWLEASRGFFKAVRHYFQRRRPRAERVAMVRLTGGRSLLEDGKRKQHDALLGALSLALAPHAKGALCRTDEGELAWVLPKGESRSLEDLLHEVRAQLSVQLVALGLPECNVTGASLEVRDRGVDSSVLLRHLRAFASLARAEGRGALEAKFDSATEPPTHRLVWFARLTSQAQHSLCSISPF